MKRIAPILTLLACSVAAFAGPDLAQARAAGWGPYLGACFLGGLVSLLTPCVFPMIPVTVSYFSKRSTLRPALGAGVYALGIISTFAIIGIAAAVLFGATGISNFAANPWVNLALGILFVVLSLNLFGLFEITVPSFLTNKLAGNTRKEGLVGPFFMGATFSVTSFTCTMPIAAALLATASKGEILAPVIGMATYGLAFAAPFFLLAMFPSVLARAPKSGDWLHAVKPALAFVELAAALKFFSNADLTLSLGLITRPVFTIAWTVIFGLLALYLFGLPKSLSSAGWIRRGLGVATLVLAGFLATGVRGAPLGTLDAFLPPDPYPSQEVAQGKLEAATYADALAKAKTTGRPIFIDFTGVNCTNCRYMEKNIFPKALVKDELAKMVSVHLYTDRPTTADRANQDLQVKLTGANSLPTYVILTPDGKVVDKFEGATNNEGEFSGFLKKGQKS